MNNNQQVILVNEKDEVTGRMEKMEAHTKGLLHRAFSVFIFNRKGEMLLQRRALNKYHSGGLWTNACCSHPYPGEDVHDAAVRRLKEELGFQTPVQKAVEFIYHSEFTNGLAEHEFDHVFTGEYNGVIHANPEEVCDFCFKDIDDVRQSLKIHPEKFTTWFHIAFPKIETWWNEYYRPIVA
ncbi:MAG: isopentenyl-diphosphate Delta-isomerase [Bacteroidota bacterium]